MTSKNRFDEAAKDWDSPLKLAMSQAFVEAVSARLQLQKTDVLLDYGCGTGLLGLGLRPLVQEVVGFDTSQGMLDEFMAKADKHDINNVRTAICDLEKDELADNSFDVIVSAMTLHHLGNPAQVIQKFVASLKAGGRIALIDLVTEDGSFHGIEREKDMGVQHRGFEPQTIAEHLRAAGINNPKPDIVHTIQKDSGDFSVFMISGAK